ncbi:MAG: 23S rRNA (adenine(2503)-C(2))-methyltransferase RlmN [Defluviitaleaceae bacterium]|nr:23S rRNA (adenine(2503)-C(2))-methyltransferase RlmN [Defluviitaleaceae bacterium]MCL2836151.1 23S rRNA (adenine(2503)-C(2))-methyltransferase RlmN [Defluviitaleaceae bacterium]
MKFDLLSAYPDEVKAFISGMGEKPYRADQVLKWVHKQYAAGYDEMTNLPKDFRARLSASACLGGAVIREKKIEPGGTIKYLLEFVNHNIIDNDDKLPGSVLVESVLMDYRHGGALCVSAQAGCAMGCVFCASGKNGLLRNLTAGEMLAQVYAVTRDSGKPVSNITMMGCGEPLDNYDNALRFIKLASGPEALGMSQRRITLSTCGLTDKILELIAEKLQITLAVSLHAPNDRVRTELMPVARAYPLEGLLAACRQYGSKTKRRVTFEYAMVMGKNDRPDHAAELAGKLRKMLCHVNLIPVNNVGTEGKRGYRPSADITVAAFRDILVKNGIETTVRRTLGGGINAACGQLISKYDAGGTPAPPDHEK